MRIQIKVITEIGTFLGLPMNVDDAQYENIKQMSCSYYDQGGFEMTTDDGGFVIISPKVIERSSMKIDIIDV